MAASNPYGAGNYKTNMGRSVTKKWKEASQISYEGDDWGDDDDDGYDEPQPVSAGNARHPAWGPQPVVRPSNRSVTNPSPSRSGGRPSFDRGDERRHFSSSAGFDSAYPTTQRTPFPEPQHDYEPSMPNYRDQPPLRLNTQSPGPMPPGFRPGSRGRQYPPYNDVPFSAPGSFPQQNRSSSNRPPPADIYQRHESPMRPDSRGSNRPTMRPDSRASNVSARQFPPRKQSLSQQPPPMDAVQGSEATVPSQFSPSANNNEDRPIPVFVRPSDIYKRMPEEMEKVRKSQESSRPSIDLGSNRVRESSVGARSTSSDSKDNPPPAQQLLEETDSARRLKPTLDPVPERKSEYGFDNLLKQSSGPQPVEETQGTNDATGVSRHPTTATASSVYTDRPDPVSASTISRNESLTEGIPETVPEADRPNFGLPLIDRFSGFGMDLGSHETPGPQTIPEAPQSPSHPPPPVPPKGDSAAGEIRAKSDMQDLKHQPTLGYRSVVQQAFDESQDQTPFSATSGSGTIDRSNSASTADISPIISRKPESAPTDAVSQDVYPAIPEEPLPSESRPTSTATLRAGVVEPQQSKTFAPPAQIRSGYRRDVTPPGRDNSPAKRPLNVEPPIHVEPQHGSLVDRGDDATSAGQQPRDRDMEEKPLPVEPASETSGFAPPSTERTTLEEWEEWQTQKRQLNVQAGLPNRGPNTPHAPSPIQRSETPAKGTVRDLAGRLESNSGRSTPVNANGQATSPDAEQSRPTPQGRLESFRPMIPGGWQSYTSASSPSTPGSITPSHHEESASQFQPRFAQARMDSTESIPTARAPANLNAQSQGITQKAFSAAAVAGSALAGALTGERDTEQTQNSHDPSEDSSENEWDRSSTSSKQGSELTTEPLAPPGYGEKSQAPEKSQLTSSSVIHAPASHPEPVSTPTPIPHATPGESDYYPAPLRTSRMFDTSVSHPSVPDVSMPRESPAEADNERLQFEIVKSLTPKSSGLTGEVRDQTRQSEAAPQPVAHQNTADTEVESMNVPSQKSSPSQSGEGVMPSIDTSLASIGQAKPPVDPATLSAGKHFLQQRFSWETGSSQPPSASTPKQMSPPSTSSPDTIRAQIRPVLSSFDSPQRISDFGQPVDRQQTPPDPPSMPTEVSNFSTVDAPASQPAKPSPSETTSFRTIMNLSTSQERVRAFNESRQAYATPNGQLEDWLMSMRTAEHSELFAHNGRVSQDVAESTTAHKPSPRRLLTESTSARHMQEDGKRLMAAAGRIGGKAGIAAKGLFAKGKEKMRNASSGEKGFISNRRKSTGPSSLHEPEDHSSHAQSRDPAVIEGPPQIPFTLSPVTPSDWFSDPELHRPPEGDVHKKLEPEPAASSTVSLNQESVGSEVRQAKEVPTVDLEPPVAVIVPATAPAPATASATAPSPTISALDSEHPDDIGIPSRSISQLTRPTAEYSPVESSHLATAERTITQESPLSQPQDTIGDPGNLAACTLVAPRPFMGHHNGSRSDVHSSDRSLNVPQARPRSIISDVSSASPSPRIGTLEPPIRRDISPADEDSRVSEPASYEKHQAIHQGQTHPDAKADGDAQSILRDSDQPPEPPREETPPPGIDEPYTPREDIKPHVSPIDSPPAEQQAHEPHQLPPAHGQEQYGQSQPRPFSFAGLEGVGEVHQLQQTQEQDLSKVPTQPMSPVSQTRSSQALSKEMSQVSAEEVMEQANLPGGQRHSRSYSRPFGVDPHVRNHPALRQPEPVQLPTDRSQMYSSESPLPSARRPPEELDRLRHPRGEQYQPPGHGTQPMAEEGYRIPGPYVQEYRSPKQISAPKTSRSQTQVQAGGQPLPSTLRAQQRSGQASPQPRPGQDSYIPSEKDMLRGYGGHMGGMLNADTALQYDMKPEPAFQPQPQPQQQHQNIQSQRQSMGPPPVPATQPAPTPSQDSRKKSAFGGLFGVGSKSRSKLQKHGRTASPIEEPIQKEKRGSIFRRNSRHDSLSSQQSSQYGGQDHVGQLPPSQMASHSAKRQSRDVRAPTPDLHEQPSEGKKKRFSGLGSKLFKSSSTSKASTTPTPQVHPSPPFEQKYSSQTIMSPQAYSAQTPYSQYPSGPGGYFHQGPQQSQPSQMYPQSQNRQQASQYSRVTSPYQHQTQPAGYPYSSSPSQPQSLPPQAQQQHSESHSQNTSPYINPDQRRPSDLRIDTKNGTRNHYRMPSTAPAQIYPLHDTSFASTPHNPQPSPGTETAHTTAPPRSSTTPTSGVHQQAHSSSQDPRAHVIALHKRARSPRLGRHSSSEDLDVRPPQHGQLTTEQSHLGTFSSKRISPVGGIPRPEGDQERPYAITVPGLDDDDERRRNQMLRERLEGGNAARSETPVSVESGKHSTTITTAAGTGGDLDRNVSVLEGHGSTSPRTDRMNRARDLSTPGIIAELPGSNAQGYESEEEIPMSATAYPGQEWVPVFVEGDGRWDD